MHQRRLPRSTKTRRANAARDEFVFCERPLEAFICWRFFELFIAAVADGISQILKAANQLNQR